MENKNLFDKVCRDKDGNIVLFQFPNLPLILWFLLLVISRIELFSEYQSRIVNLSYAFLLVWAYLETRLGVSLFRRIIGIVGISLVVYLYLS